MGGDSWDLGGHGGGEEAGTSHQRHTRFLSLVLNCLPHTLGPNLTKPLHIRTVQEIQLFIKMKINAHKQPKVSHPPKMYEQQGNEISFTCQARKGPPLPNYFTSLYIKFHFTHCQTLLAAPNIPVAMGTPGGEVGTAPRGPSRAVGLVNLGSPHGPSPSLVPSGKQDFSALHLGGHRHCRSLADLSFPGD